MKPTNLTAVIDDVLPLQGGRARSRSGRNRHALGGSHRSLLRSDRGGRTQYVLGPRAWLRKDRHLDLGPGGSFQVDLALHLLDRIDGAGPTAGAMATAPPFRHPIRSRAPS